MSLCRIVELPQNATREESRIWMETMLSASNRGKRSVDHALSQAVRRIVEDVRNNGWHASLKYTKQFDCQSLKAQDFCVSDNDLRRAHVEKKHEDAILKSIERVRAFHEEQLRILTQGLDNVYLNWGEEKILAWEWRVPASECTNSGFQGQRLIPIRTVGIYVPGGKASYPSSVIMNAVPAQVAGSEIRMICTPPDKGGRVSEAILVAARELGIRTIIKCGGAQAIALMANGAKGELNAKPRDPFYFSGVDKIVGPGNRWVNEAKRQLWGKVGLDTFAGPSEVCVVADESTNPVFAAADWLTQIEHAEDNVGYLVAATRKVADGILHEVEMQLRAAPREDVMRSALKEYGTLFIGAAKSLAVKLGDSLAAEHESIQISNSTKELDSSGLSSCIALGDYTPQSAGDFCAGPSHTLPTGGAARFSSPLNVMDFLKFQSISQFTKEDLMELLPTIEAFGEMEGFPQHARAARLRFEG